MTEHRRRKCKGYISLSVQCRLQCPSVHPVTQCNHLAWRIPVLNLKLTKARFSCHLHQDISPSSLTEPTNKKGNFRFFLSRIKNANSTNDERGTNINFKTLLDVCERLREIMEPGNLEHQFLRWVSYSSAGLEKSSDPLNWSCKPWGLSPRNQSCLDTWQRNVDETYFLLYVHSEIVT